ncbi:hypothetical protein AVEN_252175-1 [Araneus ventricosus]|uniref:Transposase Tc1-like domain-containing protein n=1 Tax=Araneus ventricosus TaxID=182803 RepID=A0A4Y2MYW9_ARAVE|nr:hypothetical protein AVEN_252175-1 [Araneus ventricosus]
MSYFSAHHVNVARKRFTGKIVLPEPAELRCRCKTIPSYEANTKRSSVSMCPTGRGWKQIPSSSVEDVATAVVEASSQSPHGTVSVPVVSRVFYMPYSTVRKLLRRILNFYPYKIKPVHLLQDRDSEVRTTFALEFLARKVVDVTWPWNIMWSDEAHFYLNGHVNTHNCRIWTAENPHAIQEQTLYPDKVTVWCGFTATFSVGPYFFEEITANGIKPLPSQDNGTVILIG